MINTKTLCSKCKEPTEPEDFSKVTKGRISKICKICSNKYAQEWRINNREKSTVIEKRKDNNYSCTINGRATIMLNNTKKRAVAKSLDHDLDKKWIVNKLEKGICEATGLELQIKTNGGKGHLTNSFSPSVERIDNSKGYTKNNVQITCWIYNRAKGAFPIEDLLTMLKALDNKTSKQTV